MSEEARRNLTRGIIGLAIVVLTVFAYYRKSEVPRLIDKIAYGAPAERLDAVQRLIDKEKLAEAMEEAPRSVQYNCVAALAQIADHDAMAQMLEAKWEFDDPIAQWCDTLLIAWDESAVGPLIEAMQNKSANIRGGTPGPLSEIGEPAKAPLLGLTGAWDLYVRDATRDTFAKAAMAPLARDELIEILKEREPRVGETPAKHLRRRDTAVRSLEAMKVPAFEPLIAMLKYEYPLDATFQAELRGQAAVSLGKIANQTLDAPILVADAVTVIAPLIEALGDPGWPVRRRAAAALGPVCKVKTVPEELELQQELAKPITPLIALLSSTQRRDVRGAAAESLGLIGSVRAAAPLGQALANDAQRAGAAQEIALALERIGEDSVPELSAALAHSDPDVRELATRTLANIGGPSSTLRLADRLNRATEMAVRVRRVAAAALRNIAEAAYAPSGPAELRAAVERVLPALAGALADTDWHVYVAARDALARAGKPAVSQLINAVGGDPRVSYTAAEGLAKIGADAVPELLAAITERPDSDVASWAAIALGDIGTPAVPDLERTLASANLSTAARANAARALGLSRDLRATDALLKAVEDDATEIRVQAVRSLADLRGVETEEKAGESAVVGALSDLEFAVRDAAMLVLEDWPGVTTNDRLKAKLEPPNDDNTRRRAAIVFAAHLRAGRLLGMSEEGGDEETAIRDRVAGQLESALQDSTEAPRLREKALELYGSAAAIQYVDKEHVRDPASANVEPFISAADVELTHAACKALASIGARVSRETMREARVGLTPGASQAAEILARHLESTATERPDLAPWYALALAEVRDTAARTLVEPGDPDDPALPTGLFMDAYVPTEEELLSDTEPKPTILWAAAVIGRIGKPAADVLFDARAKLGGLKGKRTRAMDALRDVTENYDIFDFHEGHVFDVFSDKGVLDEKAWSTLIVRVDRSGDAGSANRADVTKHAKIVWEVTRQLRWLHAAMLATRDTLGRDFVENVGDYDLLPEAQYEKLEETMDELARLKVAEW